MAPKTVKKGVHTQHEVHPQILKKRAREAIQQQKKFARFLKMSKKKRKSGTTGEVSITDDGANTTEPSSHETSLEENFTEENTDLSLSTSPLPSKSFIEGQEWINEFENRKSKKKTRNSSKSVEEKLTIERQIDEKSQKNIPETFSVTLADHSQSPSIVINCEDMEKFIKENDGIQPGDTFKGTLPFKVVVPEPTTPETPMACSSKLKKSFKTSGITKMQKEAKGFKQSKSTDAKTRQISCKSTLTNFSEDPTLEKDQTKRRQNKKGFANRMEENKTITGKAIKNKKFTKSNLHKDLLQVPSEELTNKKISLQKKLKSIELERKSLDEQEKLLTPLTPKIVSRNPGIAVNGIINIFSQKDSFENHEDSYYILSMKDSNNKVLQILDKNIQISIVVFEGTQVIFKRRLLSGINPSKNDEPCLQTLETQNEPIPTNELESKLDQQDETLTDLSNLGQVDQESPIPTLKVPSTTTLDKKVASDIKMQEKLSTHTNNLNQDDESFPEALEDQSTVQSDEELKNDKSQHIETFADSNNLNQDVTSFPKTLEGGYSLTSDNDSKSEEQQHKKNFAGSNNMDQENLVSSLITLEVQSPKALDEIVRPDLELPNKNTPVFTILDQDVESCPLTLEAKSTIPLDKDIKLDSNLSSKIFYASRDFAQDESFRQIMEDNSVIAFDKDVRCDLELIEKITAATNNLIQDYMESNPLPLGAQSTVALDQDVELVATVKNEITAIPEELKQDVKSFPQIIDIPSQSSDKDSRCNSILEVTAGPSNFNQDDVGSDPLTLASQPITSDQDVKIPVVSKELKQDVESFPQIMEGHSKSIMDKEVGCNLALIEDITSWTSNLSQDYVKASLLTSEARSTTELDQDVKLDPNLKDESAISRDFKQGVKSFPQIKGQPTASDKDLRYNSKLEVTAGNSNLNLDKVEPDPLTLQAASDPEIPEEHFRNLGQYYVENYLPILEVQSEINFEEDRCNPETHKETSTRSRNVSQDNVESCPPTLEIQSTMILNSEIGFNTDEHGETSTGDSKFDQDNVESCPPLEIQYTITMDKDIGYKSEIHGETSTGSTKFDEGIEPLSGILYHSAISSDNNLRSDPKMNDEISTNSSNLGKDEMESGYQMLDNSTYAFDKNVRPKLKKNDGILGDSACSENFMARETTREDISSALKSLQENIRKACDEFLEDCTFTCESFVDKVMNNLKMLKK